MEEKYFKRYLKCNPFDTELTLYGLAKLQDGKYYKNSKDRPHWRRVPTLLINRGRLEEITKETANTLIMIWELNR